MKTNKLLTVMAITFAIGFVASAYLNYHQHQLAAQEKKLLQGEITDLRYQMKQDKAASPSPSPSEDPEPTASPSPSESPAVAGANIITISQLDIKLTASDPVADLTYGMANSGVYKVAALTTQSLVAKYSGCRPSDTNNALGQIVRKEPGRASSGTLVKKLGNWNYFYIAPSGSCATDAAGNNALAAARAAVKNAVMPTIAQ
jgi:hypothetical protein